MGLVEMVIYTNLKIFNFFNFIIAGVSIRQSNFNNWSKEHIQSTVFATPHQPPTLWHTNSLGLFLHLSHSSNGYCAPSPVMSVDVKGLSGG